MIKNCGEIFHAVFDNFDTDIDFYSALYHSFL